VAARPAPAGPHPRHGVRTAHGAEREEPTISAKNTGPSAAGGLTVLRAECLELLAAVAAHVDDHFNFLPDEAHWGHVGDAIDLRGRLKDLSDRVAGTGEYAAGGSPAMTVQELIDALSAMDPEAEVRLAQQPGWPFECSVGEVLEADGVLYVGEGCQIGYLPGEVRSALGWR
jgi:hypothetical protein